MVRVSRIVEYPGAGYLRDRVSRRAGYTPGYPPPPPTKTTKAGDRHPTVLFAFETKIHDPNARLLKLKFNQKMIWVSGIVNGKSKLGIENYNRMSIFSE